MTTKRETPADRVSICYSLLEEYCRQTGQDVAKVRARIALEARMRRFFWQQAAQDRRQEGNEGGTDAADSLRRDLRRTEDALTEQRAESAKLRARVTESMELDADFQALVSRLPAIIENAIARKESQANGKAKKDR